MLTRVLVLTTTQQCRSIHSLQHTTNSLPIQVIEPPLPSTRSRFWLHGPEHKVLPHHEQDRDMARSSNNILHPQHVATEDGLGRQSRLSNHALFVAHTNTTQLFLRFQGPTTMLIQSRASRISDVLTLRNVDEIADSPPGAVEDAATRKIKEEIKSIGEGTKAPIPNTDAAGTVRYATVKDGKAEFETPKVETPVVEKPKV
jgi:hypothetical protein